jgi:L-lactate dehydrogenase
MPERTKLSVVGAGSVGATIAYASLLRGVAKTVAIYDINAEKTRAEVLDLVHGIQFVPMASVIGSDDVAVTAGSDVVCITAGAKQKPGQTRLDLAGVNVAMCQQLMPQLLEYSPNAVYLLVTNPVDVVTYAAVKSSGLPSGRVFGSGTVLDSSRLRTLVAEHFSVAVQSVHAAIIGEHGDSELPVWSLASIGGVPLIGGKLPGRPAFEEATRERIGREVITAAEQIIRGKGATNYAIGLAATRIIEAIFHDESGVLPVSSLLDGQYDIHDVCLSLPSIVNSAGVQSVLTPSLSEEEITLLRRSADTVREVARSLGL